MSSLHKTQSFEYLQLQQPSVSTRELPRLPGKSKVGDLTTTKMIQTDRTLAVVKSFANTNSIHLNRDLRQRNFYHHQSIYKLQEYRDLTKQHFFLPTETDQPIEALDASQRRVMMADFRRKVAEYLLMSKYKKEVASKNFRKFYSNMKLKTQSIDQSMSITLSQPNLSLVKWDMQGTTYAHNQIIKNRFNHETLFNDNMAFVVRVRDVTGQTMVKKITNKNLQSKLMRKMEPFLNDEKIDYDAKLHFMMVQFEEIVDKIESEAYHIQVPHNFTPNPSDFNEYYIVEQSQRQYKYDDFLAESILETIIETVRTPIIDDFLSKPETPVSPIEQPAAVVEELVPVEVIVTSEEDEFDEFGQKTGRRTKKPKDPKPKEQKTYNRPQQSQPEPVAIPDPEPPVVEVETDSEEQKMKEYLHQRELDRERDEERERQKRERKMEIERIEQEIKQRKNQQNPEFKYQKSEGVDPNPKKKPQKQANDILPAEGRVPGKKPKKPRKGRPDPDHQQQQQGQQQLPPLQFVSGPIPDRTPGSGANTPTRSPTRSPTRRPQQNQKQEGFPHQQQEMDEVLVNREQTASIHVHFKDVDPNSEVNEDNKSNHGTELKIAEISKLQKSEQSDPIIDAKGSQLNIGSKRELLQQPSNRSIDVPIKARQNRKKPEETDDQKKMREDFEAKLALIEDTLIKSKLSYVDILLSAQNVFEVNINEYKLVHKDTADVIVPNIEKEDDRTIYREIYSWREEVLGQIPMLKEVKRDVQPEIDEGSKESEDSDAPSPTKSKKKKTKSKRNKESDSD